MAAAALSFLVAAATTTSFASALTKDTYDFTCFGSRIGKKYSSTLGIASSPSSTLPWFGALSPAKKDSFECASLGYGLIAKKFEEDSSADIPVLPMMQSEYDLERVQRYYKEENTTGLTVEVWMTISKNQTFLPYPEEFSKAPIWTLGQAFEDAAITRHPLKGGRGWDSYDMQLSIWKGGLFFSYSDDYESDVGTGGTPKYYEITLPPPKQYPGRLADHPDLYHVIVHMGDHFMRFYIDGEPAFEDFPELELSHYEGHLQKFFSNYRFQLFSDTRSPIYFEGAIHQVTMYDYDVTPHDAKVAYLSGLELMQNAGEKKTAPPGTGNDDSTITSPPVSNGHVEGIPYLMATPNATFSIVQGDTTPFNMTLKGMSTVGPKDANGWWTLKLEVTSTTKFGRLTTLENNVVIQQGDVLDIEVEYVREKVNSRYTGYSIPMLELGIQYTMESDDYFNVPRMSMTGDNLGVEPELFGYRFLAIDDTTGDVLATSSVVMEPIHVLRVKQPSKVKFYSKRASVVDWSTKEIKIHEKLMPTGTLDGKFVVDNLDERSVDQVRVEIETLQPSGRFSLNKEHLKLADVKSCRTRDYSAWRCVGDGKNERRMTFIAYPRDLPLILSDMKYSGRFNAADTIMIKVWDGEGGQCLTKHEQAVYTDELGQEFSTFYNGTCVESILEIEIEALVRQGGDTVDDSEIVQGSYGYIFIAFVCFVCGICSPALCGCCFDRCKTGRGNIKVHPKMDGDHDSEDDIENGLSVPTVPVY